MISVGALSDTSRNVHIIQYTTLRYRVTPLIRAGSDSCGLTSCYSPCSMCTGAILLYRIPRVVIGENETFKGDEDLLRSRGVEVFVVDNEDCKNLMQAFIREHPEVRKIWCFHTEMRRHVNVNPYHSLRNGTRT